VQQAPLAIVVFLLSAALAGGLWAVFVLVLVAGR
jgi:hypothetical protein